MSSLPAKPTLFHASIAKSEPTIAAPITGHRAAVMPPAGQKWSPKLAATAAAFRPTVSPSRISPASAAVLIAVSDVWITAAVLTPRTLIHVSTAMEAIARMRCGDSPTVIAPIGGGKTIVPPRNTSGESAGKSTAVKRANATATAAIVPVWITTNSVQPYR